MHGFEDTFQPVQRANGRQDMRRIGPLGASCLEPASGFAGSQEGVQKPLGGLMGGQPVAKIVQQGEVEAWVGQFETEGILPIYTAADGIGGLAVGQPLNVLHHQD
jgi:hypothetical protein